MSYDGEPYEKPPWWWVLTVVLFAIGMPIIGCNFGVIWIIPYMMVFLFIIGPAVVSAANYIESCTSQHERCDGESSSSTPPSVADGSTSSARAAG